MLFGKIYDLKNDILKKCVFLRVLTFKREEVLSKTYIDKKLAGSEECSPKAYCL